MSVTARALSGDAPAIQVVVSAGTVPAGQAYTVRGSARGGVFSWLVRGGAGVSDGGQVVLSDPLAPVNQPITYEVVTASGVVGVSAPVQRPWSGLDALTDMTASVVADMLWQGADEHTLERRVTLHTVAGRPTPVPVFDAVMGAGEVSLTARTEGAGTQAMGALAQAATVVALLHNPAHCPWCRRGVCDVDPVTVLALTDVSHALSGRMDSPERLWSLKGHVVAVPEPGRVLASSTWADFDRVRWPWSFLDAQRMRWDAFDATVWQEVGR